MFKCIKCGWKGHNTVRAKLVMQTIEGYPTWNMCPVCGKACEWIPMEREKPAKRARRQK